MISPAFVRQSRVKFRPFLTHLLVFGCLLKPHYLYYVHIIFVLIHHIDIHETSISCNQSYCNRIDCVILMLYEFQSYSLTLLPFEWQLLVKETRSSATVTCASTTHWCATVSRTVSTPGTRTTVKVTHKIPLHPPLSKCFCFATVDYISCGHRFTIHILGTVPEQDSLAVALQG